MLIVQSKNLVSGNHNVRKQITQSSATSCAIRKNLLNCRSLGDSANTEIAFQNKLSLSWEENNFLSSLFVYVHKNLGRFKKVIKIKLAKEMTFTYEDNFYENIVNKIVYESIWHPNFCFLEDTDYSKIGSPMISIYIALITSYLK